MRRADDLIQRFLDSVGQSEGAAYVGMFRSWQPIVGERIAAHAQPVDVRGHSLVVEADHPGWVQMVMMKRQTIIREINRRYPELSITGLTVRVVDQRGAGGTIPGRTPGVFVHGGSGDSASGHGGQAADAVQTESGAQPAPPSADEEEALDRIPDDDLRSTLARLREDLDGPDQPSE